jgi:cytochrome c-type biogenesis protein CcmE
MNAGRVESRRSVLGPTLILLGLILGLGALGAGLRHHVHPAYTPGAGPTSHTVRFEGVVEPGGIDRAEGGTVRLRLASEGGGMTVQAVAPLADFVREGRSLVAVGRVDASGVLVVERLVNPHLFFVALSYGIATLVLFALAGGALLFQRRTQAEVERFVLRSRRS